MRFPKTAWLAGALAAGWLGGCAQPPTAEPLIPCYLESPGALAGVARAAPVPRGLYPATLQNKPFGVLLLGLIEYLPGLPERWRVRRERRRKVRYH